jgi:hypothetical protein
VKPSVTQSHRLAPTYVIPLAVPRKGRRESPRGFCDTFCDIDRFRMLRFATVSRHCGAQSQHRPQPHKYRAKRQFCGFLPLTRVELSRMRSRGPSPASRDQDFASGLRRPQAGSSSSPVAPAMYHMVHGPAMYPSTDGRMAPPAVPNSSAHSTPRTHPHEVTPRFTNEQGIPTQDLAGEKIDYPPAHPANMPFKKAPTARRKAEATKPLALHEE